MKFWVFLVSCIGFFGLCSAFAQERAEEEADTLYELEGITVTGTRTEKRLADAPVATEVITAKEIENSNAATITDILDDYGLMYTSS
ncbi:MAG: hypothetical protein LBT68_05265, partial [Spirochaetales bacterium]|nr:hypothetical protein [Spirochaetales bacterium]